MYLRIVLTLLALAVPAAATAQTSGADLPACSDASNCPLINFTLGAVGSGLDGVTLTPGGSGVLLARTNDSNLPAFRLMWIDQIPPLSPDRTAGEFMRGLTRPDRFCNRRPIPGSATADGLRGAFDLRCSGGQLPAIQIMLLAVQDAHRTRALILLAPLDNGPALLARGQRVLQEVAQSGSVPPRDYAQLRLDCADDGDAPRQIAGCNAVLANAGESENYAIALNNRGHAQERSGNPRAALEDYERAVARDPAYSVAQINRARVLGLLDRFGEAHAALDRAQALEDNVWIRFERARVLMRQRDGDRALVELDRAIQADPTFADALVERGRLRAGRGDHRRAVVDFEAAIAAEPGNGAAAEGLASSRAQVAGAPATAVAGQPAGVGTARGLMRDRPFSLAYPDHLRQTSDAGSELFLDHPTTLFQVSLKIAPAPAGTNAQSAARAPAASVAPADRAAFPDFALEHRALVTLPAGPAHLYVATMTSPMGNRPRLRMVVAEYFSEGRRYELAFTMGRDALDSADSTIGFILANFDPASSPRVCCAAPIALPW